MDADYDPKKARENLLEEVKKTLQGKKRRNRKKKSKLAQVLETEKPKFVPTVAEKTYDQYMEEYYKMDCEDVIGGDLPTRFKYREVVPNDYGLTIEEILLADDKELTQWVPLKKILKHRPDNVEKGDAKTYAQKAADTKLKKKILPSLFQDLPEEPEIVVPIEETKKKKKKKKKNKNKNIENSSTNEERHDSQEINTESQTNETSELIEELGSETPKKKKQKNKNKDETETNNINIEESTHDDDEQANIEENSETKQKKKKKHKTQAFVVEDVQEAEPSQESAEVTVVTNRKKKKNKQKAADNETRNADQEASCTNNAHDVSKKQSKNLKRKANFVDLELPNKKQKGNKKDFKKNSKQNGGFNKNKGPVNPLVNLSDERLKAYGLNPKKYKNFMKFKKY